MRLWVLALLVCAALAAWHYLPFPTAGVLAPAQPLQAALLPNDPTGWMVGDLHFQPLARYQITARILSRAMYWLDRPAKISPLDLALGWGRMSDPKIYNQLGIYQGGRWYAWHFSGQPPIPVSEIIASSANTHIIPANAAIARECFFMREGDVVRLTGFLVQVQWPHGGTWTSSLSRTDTGDHACEVMWVNSTAFVSR